MAAVDDLCSSFNKIGDEIDEIFKSMEVFSNNSVTSRENNKHLKGSSAEFSDEYKPNLTNSEHDVEEYRKLFSSAEKKESRIISRSYTPECTSLFSSTPSKRLRSIPPTLASSNRLTFEGTRNAGYERPLELDISHNETMNAISHEREVCKRYQAETEALRKRIHELQVITC